MKYSPWVIRETLFKSDGNPFLFLIIVPQENILFSRSDFARDTEVKKLS